jgi:hypothetical protein
LDSIPFQDLAKQKEGFETVTFTQLTLANKNPPKLWPN